VRERVIPRDDGIGGDVARELTREKVVSGDESIYVINWWFRHLCSIAHPALD
jgi:hypothetical protein